MAQLNDTMVQGDLRVTGRIFGAANSIYDEKDVEASSNHKKISADIDSILLTRGYQQSLADTSIQPGYIRLRENDSSSRFKTTEIFPTSASFGGSLSVSDNTTLQGNLLLQPASDSTYLSISVKKQDNSQYITNEITSSGPKFTLYVGPTENSRYIANEMTSSGPKFTLYASDTNYTTITATSSGPIMRLGTGSAFTDISDKYVYGQNGQTSYELTNSYLAFNTDPSANPYIKLGSGCFIRSNTIREGTNEIQFVNGSGSTSTAIQIYASVFRGMATNYTSDGPLGTALDARLKILTTSTTLTAYNFDNLKGTGIHLIHVNSDTSTNAPGSVYLALLVFSIGTWTYQLSLGYWFKMRNYNGSSWSSWVKITENHNIT